MFRHMFPSNRSTISSLFYNWSAPHCNLTFSTNSSATGSDDSPLACLAFMLIRRIHASRREHHCWRDTMRFLPDSRLLFVKYLFDLDTFSSIPIAVSVGTLAAISRPRVRSLRSIPIFLDRTLVESAVLVGVHRVVCVFYNHHSVSFAGVSDEPWRCEQVHVVNMMCDLVCAVNCRACWRLRPARRRQRAHIIRFHLLVYLHTNCCAD
jgi:hypothetical protein